MICVRPAPIGPDKAAFLRYLDDFGAVDDEQELLSRLADSRDPLPAHYTDGLGLPATATYGDAVRLLLAPWLMTIRGPSICDDE